MNETLTWANGSIASNILHLIMHFLGHTGLCCRIKPLCHVGTTLTPPLANARFDLDAIVIVASVLGGQSWRT